MRWDAMAWYKHGGGPAVSLVTSNFWSGELASNVSSTDSCTFQILLGRDSHFVRSYNSFATLLLCEVEFVKALVFTLPQSSNLAETSLISWKNWAASQAGIWYTSQPPRKISKYCSIILTPKLLHGISPLVVFRKSACFVPSGLCYIYRPKVFYECVREIRAANLSRVGTNVTCSFRSFAHSPTLHFFSFIFILREYWNATFN